MIGVAATLIVTSSAAIGTTPPDQFSPTSRSLETAPVHEIGPTGGGLLAPPSAGTRRPGV